jgi:hypothetical protein
MGFLFILNEIWVHDKIYIMLGTLLGLNILLISLYRYWLRTASTTFCSRLKSTFFLCRNTLTNKNEVALLSQLVFFSYYCANERNIALWASYSFTGPISLPAV